MEADLVGGGGIGAGVFVEGCLGLGEGSAGLGLSDVGGLETQALHPGPLVCVEGEEAADDVGAEVVPGAADAGQALMLLLPGAQVHQQLLLLLGGAGGRGEAGAAAAGDAGDAGDARLAPGLRLRRVAERLSNGASPGLPCEEGGRTDQIFELPHVHVGRSNEIRGTHRGRLPVPSEIATTKKVSIRPEGRSN